MKRLFLILFIAAGLSASAQIADAELRSLVDVVTRLRTPGEAAYTRALAALEADTKWTPMNETGRVTPNECGPSEKLSRFRLNRILNKADAARKYVSTHGDMLNGADERYNYSLYERALRAGKSETYSLPGRAGRQTIVIVPHAAQGSGITATVSGGGVAVTFRSDKSGVLVAELDSKAVSKDRPLTLTVSNTSGQPQAFVIINHNTRL